MTLRLMPSYVSLFLFLLEWALSRSFRDGCGNVTDELERFQSALDAFLYRFQHHRDQYIAFHRGYDHWVEFHCNHNCYPLKCYPLKYIINSVGSLTAGLACLSFRGAKLLRIYMSGRFSWIFRTCRCDKMGENATNAASGSRICRKTYENPRFLRERLYSRKTRKHV